MIDLTNRMLNKRPETIWRLFNVTLFIVGFFGPWGTAMGLAHGYNFLRGVIYSLDQLLVPINSKDFDIFVWYEFLKWTWFITYWAFNVDHLFEKKSTNRWLNVFLTLSLLWLLPDLAVRLTARYQRFWWPEYYWGYWLMLVSFGSSILLEFVHNQRHLGIAPPGGKPLG